MRAIEKAAIDSGAVTGLELMERAGRGVVEAILAEWPELARGAGAGGPSAPRTPRGHLHQGEEGILRAVVLCGPGNNGGDGFVVARLLKDRGWEVEVFLYGDPDKLPPDAKANYARWCGMGEVRPFAQAPRFSHEADLYVDALFGTGLTRPLAGAVFDWAADRTCDHDLQSRTVAVDIPSGLCSDSGRELARGAETVLAGLTVTFHSRKLGHVLKWGPYKCGKVVVKDIGLPREPKDAARLVEGPFGCRSLGKADLAHKYTHGHALILSGAPGHGGAARLAARGALRIGAGLVTVGCPPEALAENAARLDAVMLRPVHDAEALGHILKDARMGALGLGPGLGLGEREAGLVAAALAAGRATVLDADALTLIAREKALFAALHEGCVLTPHGGEFARLFPDLAERLEASASEGPAFSKVDAAREAAARAGCVVLFKGPDTVIAAPNGRCAVNAAVYERAAPWLATAGAGDVLAGFIVGLMARGFSPFDAAATAAWLHVECARDFGPGLIAEDLPEALPGVFRNLGL